MAHTIPQNSDEDQHEQTPLLPSKGFRRKRTPLPKLQIGILLIFQLAEPISSQCIYPFINQLVRELGVTGGDDRKVGYYAGLIQSLFFLTEACTVLHWSRLSDRVGRKPILLLGLSGLSISMLAFGLSKTFWAVIVSRCLAGLLNGNIGVMKSMMAELTDSTNMAKAVALLPIVWSTGATLGPIIGGTFAKPHDRFPDTFSSPFWEKYPYFLPCAIAAGFAFVSFVTAAVFLKETVAKPRWKLWRRSSSINSLSDSEATVQGDDSHSADEAPPLRELLTKPVVIAVMNYNLLSLMDIMMFAIFPLFCYTPIEHGGLGLEPAAIGYVLGAWGAVSGLFQVFLFDKIVSRWGPKKVFSFGMASFVPCFVLYPIINYLARQRGLDALTWAVLGAQLVIAVGMEVTWGCAFMFITFAAPRKALGATNGLAQTVTSIMRAIGPAFSTSLFAFSIDRQILGGHLVYVILATLGLLTSCATRLLPDHIKLDSDDDGSDDGSNGASE